MEGAFWKEIVKKVLQDETSLSQKKIVKRAVREARQKQPGLKKDFLQRQASLYLQEARTCGDLVDRGTKLALAPPPDAKSDLKPATTPLPNSTAGKATKKRKAAVAEPAVRQPAEAGEPVVKKAKRSKSQQDRQPAAGQAGTPPKYEAGGSGNAALDAGRSAAVAEPAAKAAKSKKGKAAGAAVATPGAEVAAAEPAAQAAKSKKGKAAAAAAVVNPGADVAAEKPAPEAAKSKKNGKAAAAATPGTASAKAAARKAAAATNGAPGSGSPGKMPAIGGRLSNGADWAVSNARTDVKRGRYTPAEKEKLLQAIKDYAQEKGLSETDFSWLFQTKTGEQRKQTAGAWTEIATTALPNRTAKSVWAYGTRILHPDHYKGTWNKKDKLALVELVEARGKKWKEIGAELGRLPGACKDCYKELAVGGEQRGKWSKEEEAALESAVNDFLSRREAFKSSAQQATLSLDDLAAAPAADSPAKSDGRVLLDDIDWKAIADKVGTRTAKHCLDKWYRQLAPSMVARGEWGSGDDRRLLKALLASGASLEHEVSWGELVPNRSAQQAQRRWRLMVKRVPDRYDKEFSEHLDFLIDTFAPNLRTPKGV